MRELLEKLAIPRAVGTLGNEKILNIVSDCLQSSGYSVTEHPFSCMVWDTDSSWLEGTGIKLPVFVSPYSNAFEGNGIAKVISTIDELEKESYEKNILFLIDELAKESLQPKDYPFYYPEEHKRIIDTLEKKKPLAVIAVTGKHPMCGQEPFPLLEDGNFEIPSACISVDDYEKLATKLDGNSFYLKIASKKESVESRQIIASRKSANSKGTIAICAHMDSKNFSPAALDNASGLLTLLKVAEKLECKDYDIDIIPFNTEEYFQPDGELLYLEQLQAEKKSLSLFINIDSVGHTGSKVAVSLYNFEEDHEKAVKSLLKNNKNVEIGDCWYAGDHTALAFSGTKCIAIASSDMFTGGLNNTHTPSDTINTVDVSLIEDAISFTTDILHCNGVCP